MHDLSNLFLKTFSVEFDKLGQELEIGRVGDLWGQLVQNSNYLTQDRV